MVELKPVASWVCLQQDHR